MLIVGVTFIIGGGVIVKGALGAKNLIESSLFGLLGVCAGLFLVCAAVFGPPD
jgi:hypothetical protein